MKYYTCQVRAEILATGVYREQREYMHQFDQILLREIKIIINLMFVYVFFLQNIDNKT